MTLRTKMLLTVSGTLLIGVGIIVFLAAKFLREGIERIEQEQIEFRMRQVQSFFWAEQEALKTASEDWGEWATAVRQIKGDAPRFGDQFTLRVFANLKANAILYFNAENELSIGRQMQGSMIEPVNPQVVADLKKLLGTEAAKSPGIVKLGGELYLISISDVRTESTPRVGYVAFLRKIDDYMRERLATRSKQEVELVMLVDGNLPDELQTDYNAFARPMAEGEVHICPLPMAEGETTQHIAGYTVFNDINGQPVLAARIELPRTFREKHRQVAIAFTGVMASIVIVGGVLSLIILQTQVVRRVQKLASGVRTIASGRDWSKRVPQMSGQDELKDLSTSVNELLGSAQSAENSMREQEARFRLLFDAAPFPVIVSEMQSARVLRINARAAEIFKVAQHDGAGQYAPDYYVNPIDRSRLRDMIERDEQVDDFEVQLKDAEGNRWWALISGKRIVFEGVDAILVALNDITRRVQAEQALRKSEHRLAEQSRSLTELTAFHSDDPETDLRMLLHLLEQAARVLGVERTSAWVYTPDRDAIRCIAAHDPGGTSQHDALLAREQAPAYFEAIDKIDVVAANDVLEDPRTRELAPYAASAGITSMLDVPLRRGDETVGVFCCEHIGPLRTWASDEQHYALSVGNLISLGMTERHLRESRMRLRLIVDTAHDGFVALNDDGVIVDWNQQAEHIFGYSRTEALGRRVSELITPPENADECEQKLRSMVSSVEPNMVGHRIEMPAMHKDGLRFLVEITISPAIRSLDETIFGAFIRDITERKRQEQLLRDARTEAEAAARAKSAFLANMSHELRTPLNGVLGYAQILQRDSATTDKQRETLQSIAACGEHLLTLINDILDLSRIEAGQVQLFRNECNIADIAESTASVSRPRAEQKGLPLEVIVEPDVPKRLITDERRLRQVLVNLLSNAVKFTSEGNIRLRIWREKAGDGECQLGLEVVDTGIGIDDAALEDIFDAFRQTEDGSRLGGTGLGLSISRELVRALGGEIFVDSKLGSGSRFWFLLPVKLPDSGEDIDVTTDASSGNELVIAEEHSPLVLIADDQPTNRDVLRGLLESAGFSVVEAANGQEALHVLREHRPQAALVDLRMPVMDGLALAKAIRGDAMLRSIAIIAVTASVFDESRQALLAAGCDDFIGKPVKASDLLHKLASLVEVKLTSKAAKKASPDQMQRPTAPAVSLPHLAAKLREAAAIGSVEEIEALVERAAEARGDDDQLVQSLREAARVFEFERIAKLANELAAEPTDASSSA